jgi:uncharacterized coiled-coil protein SlyX
MVPHVEYMNSTLREAIVEEQRCLWKGILETEESKWKITIAQLELSIGKYEDQIIHLESVVTQKELELLRLQESYDLLESRFREADDAQKAERTRLRTVCICHIIASETFNNVCKGA